MLAATGSRLTRRTFEEIFMSAKRLTIQQRKDIFSALVAAQDTGLMTIRQSVEKIARDFEITEAQLRQIEEEGVEKEWPPLDEAAQTIS
jgi:hypothetical protein